MHLTQKAAFISGFLLGIPFFITNNFYGNKLFYPALNSHQRTVKYVFGRLPWLKLNFFSVKKPPLRLLVIRNGMPTDNII
mgnify:CR=1 FL=1